MTDRQLLLSIKGRASQRLGNFMFIKIVDELLEQATMVERIEKNVMDRTAILCKAFGVKLDQDDTTCINSTRPLNLENQMRIARLRKAGMQI